jgi:hypothetical protein
VLQHQELQNFGSILLHLSANSFSKHDYSMISFCTNKAQDAMFWLRDWQSKTNSCNNLHYQIEIGINFSSLEEEFSSDEIAVTSGLKLSKFIIVIFYAKVMIAFSLFYINLLKF